MNTHETKKSIDPKNLDVNTKKEFEELDAISETLSVVTLMQKENEELLRQLDKRNEELRIMSITDPLTRLYNRRYFMDIVEKELHRSKRNDIDMSIILMDIDHFKKINDTRGHQVGDDVLVMVSSVIKKALRKYDHVARYGGEEFIVLLPETNIDQAMSAGEKIREEIELHRMASLAAVKVTVSIGISTLSASDKNIDEIIKRADDALYQAKNGGRNCVKCITV